jgi:uncharacterized protein YrzB (UPF0473 family)
MADNDNNGIDETEGPELVVLEDADGNELNFAFLGVVELEGEGEFALLAPAEQMLDEDDDALDVFIFRYDYDDEEELENFLPIEDDELVQRVAAVAEKMLESGEEEDEEEDEEELEN